MEIVQGSCQETNERGLHEERCEADFNHSFRAPKPKADYETLVPLLIEMGATHNPTDGECAHVIQKAHPEMKAEGANRREINPALVKEAVSRMDTFQVTTNGTVLNFVICTTTDRGCRVNRLLLLSDTGVDAHHAMLMP